MSRAIVPTDRPMCGRFLNTASNDELGGLFGTLIIGDQLPVPSSQTRPTDDIRVVLESKKEAGRRLEGARWDLARPGQKALKQDGPPLINLTRSALARYQVPRRSHPPSASKVAR